MSAPLRLPAWRRAGLVIGLTFWSGCATYQPAPLDPHSQLATFYARGLNDPGFSRWLDSLGVGAVGPVRRMALAAEFFSPARNRWQADRDEADAGLVSAGARPSPGAGTDLEYAFSDPQASSSWVIGISGLFTIELGGKRGARLARAQAHEVEVRTRIDDERWQRVGLVYRAYLEHALQQRRVEEAKAELVELDTVSAATRARYLQGTLGRLEVARAEAEYRSASAELAGALRDAAAAQAGLAAAIGVPVKEVAERTGPWSPGSGCELADRSDAIALGRRALEAHPSVWHGAAVYLIAEADLRAEVARATPDLELGPGLLLDQGTGKLTLSALLPSIPFNRNRGPIAEAEARRRAAGAAVAEVQETVLSEVETARAGCRAAETARAAVDTVAAGAAERLALAEAAWSRGELGRLDLAHARLELLRARRLSLEAQGELDRAGLELELSLGAWGRFEDGPWPAMLAHDSTGRSR